MLKTAATLLILHGITQGLVFITSENNNYAYFPLDSRIIPTTNMTLSVLGKVHLGHRTVWFISETATQLDRTS
jgi:hypothetical protein